MAIERTLILIKPDGMKKRLIGEIFMAFEATSLKLVAAKIVNVTDELARKHYARHKDNPAYQSFFEDLIKFIKGDFHGESRVLAFIYEGENAIKKVRSICGATNPEKAEPNTIRGKYGRITTGGRIENIVHASGAVSEADTEIAIWFKEDEIWKA
jgi:nucleoside-diphosphate kinase